MKYSADCTVFLLKTPQRHFIIQLPSILVWVYTVHVSGRNSIRTELPLICAHCFSNLDRQNLQPDSSNFRIFIALISKQLRLSDSRYNVSKISLHDRRKTQHFTAWHCLLDCVVHVKRSPFPISVTWDIKSTFEIPKHFVLLCICIKNTMYITMCTRAGTGSRVPENFSRTRTQNWVRVPENIALWVISSINQICKRWVLSE